MHAICHIILIERRWYCACAKNSQCKDQVRKGFLNQTNSFKSTFRKSHIANQLYNIQWRIQDFPDGGLPTSMMGRQPIIWPFFPENCMKMNEFGPRGWGGGLKGLRVPDPTDPPIIIDFDVPHYSFPKLFRKVCHTHCVIYLRFHFLRFHFKCNLNRQLPLHVVDPGVLTSPSLCFTT